MKKSKITKILIANRGEIAIRVIRTAQEMGIGTVAIYSAPDRKAPHVRLADEAVYIGPAPVSESYLNQKNILDACKATKADAIHPGYGFLSENAQFASLVSKNGIQFIGPSPESIDVMGNKLKAKALAKEHDIPLVPGTDKPVSKFEEAVAVAKQIGFPILVKASAGGGGKGMRIVEEANELEESIRRAMSEAESAFGDGSVFIEKFVKSPRHIEFQILADNFGNTVHLFERECSVQRRYQKVVEEAPSSLLTPELRREMGECAVRIAKACNYSGAGTVEFIMDEANNYYFLEMNTRLQVEHPVTEMITGIDLVEEQIKVAQNIPLDFEQDDLAISGHSIELRVSAEDPENNFLPDTGTIVHYELPGGPGVRVDHGAELGTSITPNYDPMISKLIVWDKTRKRAISKMIRAIKEYRINGVQTTLAFGAFVMNNKAFQKGNFDTNFVKQEYLPTVGQSSASETMKQAALMTAAHFVNKKSAGPKSKTKTSNWNKRKTLS